MKKKNRLLTTSSIVGIMIFTTFFQGCITSARITRENDVVYSTRRTIFEYEYRERENRSPLIGTKQWIIKEIHPDNKIAYMAYDVLVLSEESFRLQDKVFVLADNDVFPLNVETLESESTTEISEDRSDIFTSDSTKLSVVTGYSEDNRKITRFSYALPNDIISRIKIAGLVQFRYYSGPDMLTVKLRGRKLQKLKKAINEP